jgi:hypothetical protein
MNAPWMTGATDLAGADRIINATVDMGCYEITVTDLPVITITNKVSSVAAGESSYVLMGTNTANVIGPLVLSNVTWGLEQSFARTGTQWQAPAVGLWDGHITRLEVYGSNAAGVVRHDWVEIAAPNLTTHYVSTNGSHQFPYASWATASTSLQAAVEVALPGDTVLVGDGLYRSGGGPAQARENRVVIGPGIEVRSLNGPGASTIEGVIGAVRCASVGPGATLAGFTLSSGYGGAYVDGGLISNCVVSGCSDPVGWGAGIDARVATVSDCVVEYVDGIHGAIRTRGGLVERCELRHNSMTGHGGGIYAEQAAVVRNCLIYSNHCDYGGALTLIGSEADGCTVENNSNIARVSGILLRNGSIQNSISWSDDSGVDAGSTGSFAYCCLALAPDPAANGGGNITLNPRFVASGSDPFCLAPESPCIDAGWAGSPPLTQDLRGTPRPLDGDLDSTNTMDMGAHEFDPDTDSDSDLMPDYWEKLYGLNPTNAMDAVQDPDQDGLSNLSEYIAGTHPFDGASTFLLNMTTTAEPSEFRLTWASVPNRWYTVFRTPDLEMWGWTEIESGIAATPHLNVYVDIPPPHSQNWHYRIRVDMGP